MRSGTPRTAMCKMCQKMPIDECEGEGGEWKWTLYIGTMRWFSRQSCPVHMHAIFFPNSQVPPNSPCSCFSHEQGNTCGFWMDVRVPMPLLQHCCYVCFVFLDFRANRLQLLAVLHRWYARVVCSFCHYYFIIYLSPFPAQTSPNSNAHHTTRFPAPFLSFLSHHTSFSSVFCFLSVSEVNCSFFKRQTKQVRERERGERHELEIGPGQDPDRSFSGITFRIPCECERKKCIFRHGKLGAIFSRTKKYLW